jgi:hypothetical protein
MHLRMHSRIYLSPFHFLQFVTFLTNDNKNWKKHKQKSEIFSQKQKIESKNKPNGIKTLKSLQKRKKRHFNLRLVNIPRKKNIIYWRKKNWKLMENFVIFNRVLLLAELNKKKMKQNSCKKAYLSSRSWDQTQKNTYKY